MAERADGDDREGFARETERVMARRVPLGVGFFVGVVAIAGGIEWAYFPARLPALFTSFSVEMLCCGMAVLVSRMAPLRRHVIPLTLGATLGVVLCITWYVVTVD